MAIAADVKMSESYGVRRFVLELVWHERFPAVENQEMGRACVSDLRLWRCVGGLSRVWKSTGMAFRFCLQEACERCAHLSKRSSAGELQVLHEAIWLPP